MLRPCRASALTACVWGVGKRTPPLEQTLGQNTQCPQRNATAWQARAHIKPTTDRPHLLLITQLGVQNARLHLGRPHGCCRLHRCVHRGSGVRRRRGAALSSCCGGAPGGALQSCLRPQLGAAEGASTAQEPPTKSGWLAVTSKRAAGRSYGNKQAAPITFNKRGGSQGLISGGATAAGAAAGRLRSMRCACCCHHLAALPFAVHRCGSCTIM